MPAVLRRKEEGPEQFVRRFKRESDKEGRAARARRIANGFEKPSMKRKREKAAAVKRLLKKLSRENRSYQESSSDF